MMPANPGRNFLAMSMHRKILILTAVGLGCTSGQIRQSVPPRLPEGSPSRVHRTWSVFAHPQMGYELPIPPGVRAAGDPVAGKEARFQSADGDFAMAASGGTISDYPARVIATQWNSALRKADRRVTYQRRGNTWFVVSGTDAQGIEFYEKFTMRGQQVAFLIITFPYTNPNLPATLAAEGSWAVAAATSLSVAPSVQTNAWWTSRIFLREPR